VSPSAKSASVRDSAAPSPSDERNRRAGDEGWVTYVLGGENGHLTEEQRRLIEEEMRRRTERRGRLLAVVEVRVYENETEPQVSFPPGALLKPESDGREIIEVVERARVDLAVWH
jgi:hypothetical protein